MNTRKARTRQRKSFSMLEESCPYFYYMVKLTGLLLEDALFACDYIDNDSPTCSSSTSSSQPPTETSERNGNSQQKRREAELNIEDVSDDPTFAFLFKCQISMEKIVSVLKDNKWTDAVMLFSKFLCTEVDRFYKGRLVVQSY